MQPSTNKRPPSLEAGLIAGHFFRFRGDPTGYLQEMSRLGDVSWMRMFSNPAFFINHPDLIRDLLVTSNAKFIKGRALQRSKMLLGEGLLTSEGDFHLRQRRMIQPAFHRERIAGYAASMVEYGQKMNGVWEDGQVREIDRDMMKLTLWVVGRTLFGVDVEEEVEEVGRAMNELLSVFNFLLIPFSEYLEKLPIPYAIKCRRAIESLDRTIYKIIEERRRNPGDRGDLMSMLLLAQDEEGDGEGMSDKQVRDEALTLFLAGHETTANALTFTWYLLSQNPECEKRLHSELEEVLGGRTPGFEDLQRLKYTEAVVAESMRLLPPVWGIGRIAAEEHEFGGYKVPEGAVVFASPYVIQRDERFWSDPDSFDPDRWAEKSIRAAGQEFIYLPFSRGVRSCIGESFAWTEAILLVATIAQKWKLRPVADQRFGLDPKFTLRPKYGMRMSIEERRTN